MIALVPTCNRPLLFKRLALKLKDFTVFGFVNNSTPGNIELYRALEKELPPYVRLIFTHISGEPKQCHVRVFRQMLNSTNGECLIIEDDVNPCDNFKSELDKRISALNKISKCYTLSPIYLPNRNSDRYTGGTSRKFEYNGFEFMDQAWVDGNFYMTDTVCREMKQWIQDPVKVFGASSGIGRLNSKEIVKRGWKMFTTVPTLVEHLDQESVMFGKRRSEIPLIARFRNK